MPAIETNFSKNAATYDLYATIQSEVLEKTLGMIELTHPKTILDLGCGTGNSTLALRTRFPQADILGVDFSQAMLSIAKQKVDARFRLWDIEKGIPEGSFDLIFSSAVLHWVESPPRAPNIIFSVFGPQTYHELAEVMRFPVVASRFRNLAQWQAFGDVRQEFITKTFPSLKELLKSIKYSGTRGATGRAMWTPDYLAGLEADYRMRYGGIRVTYEIIYGKT